MSVIENVMSDLALQRHSWNEFKAAQEQRLNIAEKEIRKLFAAIPQSDRTKRAVNQIHTKEKQSC